MLDVWPNPAQPLPSMPSCKESRWQNGEQRGHQDRGQYPRLPSPSLQETWTEAIFNTITQPLMTTNSIKCCKDDTENLNPASTCLSHVFTNFQAFSFPNVISHSRDWEVSTKNILPLQKQSETIKVTHECPSVGMQTNSDQKGHLTEITREHRLSHAGHPEFRVNTAVSFNQSEDGL